MLSRPGLERKGGQEREDSWLAGGGGGEAYLAGRSAAILSCGVSSQSLWGPRILRWGWGGSVRSPTPPCSAGREGAEFRLHLAAP